MSRSPNAHEKLATLVRRLLRERFDAAYAMQCLSDATQGDIYICGGVLRRALLGDPVPGDIDVMVPNDDDRVFRALDSLNVPFSLNRHHQRKYRWNYLEIDIFQPKQCFRGFNEVEDALRFFDLEINALALYWRDNRILDPFGVLSRLPLSDPRINWVHWDEADSQHLVVLAIRLAKILHEAPTLSVSATDAERLALDVLPKIRECSWDIVQQRFPLGKDAFLELFESIIKGTAPHAS